MNNGPRPYIIKTKYMLNESINRGALLFRVWSNILVESRGNVSRVGMTVPIHVAISSLQALAPYTSRDTHENYRLRYWRDAALGMSKSKRQIGEFVPFL